MYQLRLKNFKAHKELDIKFDNKSFLLYGDNGAGKSSIYEALKVKFFEDKIKTTLTSKVSDEEYDEVVNEFWIQYKNSSSRDSFNIDLLQAENREFNIENYQVFMLNLDDTEFDKYLSIDSLIKKVYFSLSIDVVSPLSFSDIENRTKLSLSDIENRTNELLEEFKEDIKISIDSEDKTTVKITDENRKLIRKKNIKDYFNEAKLNLVVLSILFSIIELSQDNRTHKILILDDFITSLDVSNRTFLMKYILETFGDKFQIVILTHNVYFYNLIMYLVNDIYKLKNDWQYANLYEIANEAKLYMNDNLIELPKLRKEIYGQNPNYTRIGNDLRKKFERLLYEFSKILMIGSVEESNKILEILDKKENMYLLRYEYIDSKKRKQVMFKNSNHLVIELEKLIEENKTIDDIKNLISTYSEVDKLLPEIIKVIQELKLYQKVSMHSLSHGQVGQNPISQKEIEKSLELLENFQKQMQSLVNKKVDGA